MKSKRIITLILAGACLLGMAACQTAEPDKPTDKSIDNVIAMANKAKPDQTAEADKPTDKSIDNVIAIANQAKPGDAPAQTGLAKRMGAPTHYKDEFTTPKGNLKVSIDADVAVPESDAIKVLSVGQSGFTQETANALMSALLHGQLYKCKAAEKTPISGKFENPSYSNTKGEWKVSKDISQIQGMAQSNAGYEVFTVKNTDDGLCNQVIYQRKPIPVISFYGIGQYYTPGEISDIESGTAKGHLPFTSEQIKDIKDISITKEAAIAQADTLVKKIGADMFTCCTAEKVYGGDSVGGVIGKLRCVWRLRYTRTENGIQATYTDEDCGAVRDEDVDPNDDCKSNGLNDPWAYEGMTVCVDDSGITDFYWQSPYKVTGTSVENANVITFDNAMNVFKTMVPVKNLWFSSGNKGEIKITGIKFGLSRITKETKRHSGILVPVWDFFGTITYDQDGNTQIDSRPEHSILTINAIDGSIIDRGFGY